MDSNHIHRYKKINLARKGNDPYIVYRCVKPTCTHYMPIELADGKLCECVRCGEAMIINKAVLVGNGGKPMTNPHCSHCIRRRKDKAENVAVVEEFLQRTKA